MGSWAGGRGGGGGGGGGVWLCLLMVASGLLLVVSGPSPPTLPPSPPPPPPPPPPPVRGDDAGTEEPPSSSSSSSSSSSCPSCALADVAMKRNSSSSASLEVVEAVKRHILAALHLSGRPNLTRPAVPRAALLNAIRKLQVGRVGEDGTVEIIQDGHYGGGGTAGAEPGPPPEPPSEIITFAEPGDAPSTVTFDLSKEGSSSSSVQVEQANVWLFLKLAKGGSRSKGKVTIQLLQVNHTQEEGEEPVCEKLVDTRRSGWHTLPVPRSVQALLDGGGHSSLDLRVSCPLCAQAGATPVLASPSGGGGGDTAAAAAGGHSSSSSSARDQSHRPFLMVVLRGGEDHGHHSRAKRGLECDGKIRICCKRQFYVNFKDIGWNDWIIAPPGYHANYCEGECPSHMASIAGSTLSFHSTVINHYRMRGYSPFQNMRSCCIPTRLRAMSMLYYNEEQKIIKKDIQNMIVEECGCS